MGAVPIGGFTPLVVTPGTNQNMVFSGPNMPGLINSKPTGSCGFLLLVSCKKKIGGLRREIPRYFKTSRVGEWWLSHSFTSRYCVLNYLHKS